MSDTKRRKVTNKRKSKAPDTEAKRDLYLWLALAVCVLLFLSDVGIGGPVGNAIGRFFFGLFGIINYVLPIALLIGIFFAVSNKGNVIAKVKLIAAVFFVIFLDGIIAVILFGKNQPTLSEAYFECFKEKSGGGLLGTMIASPFAKGFGSVLTVILFLIFMMICLVLVTERGFLSRFIDRIEKKNEGARSEVRGRRDNKRSKIEVQSSKSKKNRLKRAEKKVSGINVGEVELSEAEPKKFRRNKKEGLREVTSDDLEEIKKKEEEEKAAEALEPQTVAKEAVDLYSGKDVETEIHVGVFGEDEGARSEVRGARDEGSSSEFEVRSSQLLEADDESVDHADVTETGVADPNYSAAADSDNNDYSDVVEDSTYEALSSASDDNNAASGTTEVYGETVTPVQAAEAQGSTTDSEQAAEVQESKAPVQAAGEQESKAPVQAAEEAQKPAASVQAAEVQKPAVPPRPYQFPPVSLLTELKQQGGADSREYLQQTAEKLEVTLKNFGVDVKVTDVTCGPAVTRYELHPKLGVKVSKIVNLADDIKLNLAARDIRIEAPIPGKSAVGIEVPNKNILTVPFREMVESPEFKSAKSKIAFAAGRDIAGKVIISDIAKMPHLLIAGATGSGKSVCINTIIMSIIYRAKPEEVKFIMIDPKVVELSVYNGIPHLMIPVVTDPKKAAGALNWAVHEMDDRYKKFADTGVRDIKGYNAKIKNGKIVNREGVEVNEKKLPQIVVIVDELADLMMQSPKDVEASICRLAQLARACGIHLVIATQRPSVNVITGLIKANMPSRIAFAVTSGVDSRTILDMNGAEKLLGKGDMLYFPQGMVKPLRVQGAFVPDEDVSKVVEFLRKENETPEEDTAAINDFIENSSTSDATQISEGGNVDDGRDQYFADAGRLIIEKQKGSIGMLQRNFKIGFNRAARIMDQLEEAGVVGAEIGTKPRTVRMTMGEFEEMLNS